MSTFNPHSVSSILVASVICSAQPALAQSSVSALRQELDELKRVQSEISDRIESVELSLSRIELDTEAPVEATISEVGRPVEIYEPKSLPHVIDPKFAYSGDVRLRLESNANPSRTRGVFRARLRGEYSLSDLLSVGGEIVTGDRDDPNTADVTLSQFADDVDLGLSQLYVKADIGNVTVLGGKFPQPLERTDLVWDGDVNPQGISGLNRWQINEALALDGRGVLFVIDENASGDDSYMLGGQVVLRARHGGQSKSLFAIGYYDYSIGSIENADAGDFRTNLLDVDGDYLSDFNLIDVIVTTSHAPFGDQWPVGFTANYVKNMGSATGDDLGYFGRISIGRSEEANDLRFSYGYSTAETDAVFAAFSNDNLGIATNYKAHELGIDYQVSDFFSLNTTWYRYSTLAGATNWRDRLRLNASIHF